MDFAALGFETAKAANSQETMPARATMELMFHCRCAPNATFAAAPARLREHRLTSFDHAQNPLRQPLALQADVRNRRGFPEHALGQGAQGEQVMRGPAVSIDRGTL